MTKKRGLGRGLEALIPIPRENGMLEASVKDIPLDDISPGSRQARRNFDQEKIKELADSIKEFGVIQPVIVRKNKTGGFELIAGERRWRACKEAGLKTIPALIKEMGDAEVPAVSLIENIQRENLNPLEEALAYRTLLEEYAMTQEELSARLGKSRPFVANMLRLLELPDSVKLMLQNGELTAGHARAVLSLPGEREREMAAEKIRAQQLNVRQAERLVKKILDGEETNGEEKTNRWQQVYRERVASIGSAFGCKTRVRGKKRGGYVFEMEFLNEGDLLHVLEIMANLK
ncbi:MAG: ParB/RepB/Spo0J family partition protein [Firmicutes bacterium]|nr:ParB/RepB/Spo0J family partition protein [Bacillota bacterium]